MLAAHGVIVRSAATAVTMTTSTTTPTTGVRTARYVTDDGPHVAEDSRVA